MSEAVFNISVVLATDTLKTIRAVIERLRRQTVKEQIELVLVAPHRADIEEVLRHREEFAAIQLVEDPLDDLADARAVGIRAATAPFVFIGETHSYPRPNFFEETLKAFAQGWDAVVPSFGNANPKGVLSWAGLLSDYGAWAEGTAARQIEHGPFYNASFRRDALLEFGDRLSEVYLRGLGFWPSLMERGKRAATWPAAVIDHVNVSQPGHWMHERYLAGLLIAGQRVLTFPWWKRLVYIGGAFLLPPLLLSRMLPGLVRTVRAKGLPLAVVPTAAAGFVIAGFGEWVGYIFGSSEAARRAMHEYEVHKLAYIGPPRP